MKRDDDAALAARDAKTRKGTSSPPPSVVKPAHVRRLEDEIAQRSPERSLFGEILDWMLAPLLLVWPMSIAATYLVAQTIAAAPFDRELEASTHVLAQQMRPLADHVSLTLPISARDILRADERDHVYYQVWGVRGDFLAGDRELPLPPEEDAPQPGVVQFRDVVVHGTEIRVAWLYVGFEGRYRHLSDFTPALVQVGETLEKRSQLANEIIKGVILPQFLILPVAVLLVWAGLSRGIRPLESLVRRMRARRPDDLSPIDTRVAPEEVAPLVAAFNDLLARVAATMRQQKRFIGDAAHQMKTPLAGLRTQAELALRQDDPVELKRSLRQVARSTERATHLINQLLALARAEGHAGAPRFEAVDLAVIARGAAMEFFDAAWRKRIDLGFEAPDDAHVVHGHAVLLGELVKNLVDNALRYTPEHGTVTVRVRGTGPQHRPTLEIEDTGPGVPDNERHLVVERFYRVLGTGQDGSGLGLAIVREIALQHGAALRLGVNPRAHELTGGDASRPGLLVALEFPAGDADAARDAPFFP